MLLKDKFGPIAVLTLNRPEARNAISDALREELREALHELNADDEARIVVLTGAGSAFCAGGDIRAMQERLAAPLGTVAIDGWRRQHRTFDLSKTLHDLDKVTVAAVNGPATGLGFDLALACDFIVAAPTAWFSASFVDRGLVADGGGLYYLPRRIGLQKTKDLLFSGRRVEVAEAEALGIVDVVAGEGRLLEDVHLYAHRFTEKAPASIMLMKSILNRSFELSLESIAAAGSQAQAIAYTTDDHRVSVEHFLNRN